MAEKPVKPKKGEERFNIRYEQSLNLCVTQIIVDKETGVNYVYMAAGYGAGLSPLLDAEGNVVITPVTN